MSMLPPEITNELGQLIQGLQSPNNDVRSQAEEVLANNWTNTRPEILLMGLAEHIAGSPQTQVRSFAAVLFRKIASKTRKNDQNQVVEIFISIGNEQAIVIRQKLLECLVNESDRSVRNKISDAVAEVGRQYTDAEEHWSELLTVLFQLSIADDAGKRESAFRVFNTTPGIIEKQHEEAVGQAFTKGFKDPETAVRLAAMEAFASFFRNLGKKRQQKYYQLVPEVLNILLPIKEKGDADELSKALVALIDLAETAPKMFKPLFSNLVQFSISVIQDKDNLSDICRQNALELMATFADYAPSMCKKDPSYTNDMITQCLSLMTDLGDDDDVQEWLEADDLDQEESDQNHVAGEQCMDRLANKLGGLTILAPTFNWLPRMMLSQSWSDKHAALMAISAISEGCRDQMLGELRQVLDLVVPALSDPHPRVRWAGCNALGQMSTDFAPNMQKEYYDVILKAIIPVLGSPEPRVKSHAAAALVNFCEEAEKSVLEPYLDELLSSLYNLLQCDDKRYVQEQALSTIATIADAAEAAFSKYYDVLMPNLFNVLQSPIDKETRLLKAKAMECATLIGLAVGKERLGLDAMKLVQLLANIQTSVTEPDDPQAQYLMHCWGRMCRVMGSEFLPFLPNVMPPLLELAKANADVQLLEDDEQVEALQQEDGWELVPVKGKMIGIKTSTMDDKHMAIELLVVYAQVLEANFAPYVAEVMQKIALPGLAFFFHDPVRYMSAKLVPQLLNSYKKAYGNPSTELAGLWAGTVEKLLEVLTAEPSIDTLAEMYQCFYESVECLGRDCLTAAHMEHFIVSVQSALDDYKTRVTLRAEETAGVNPEEMEDEAEELLMQIEDDQTLLSDMNKAFHSIFKYHGAAFLRHWEVLIGTYESFLNNASDPTQRQWGLCIMDDVLEYCGPESIHYANYIMTPLLDGCRDPSPAIRQAAAYGIGVAAQKGGQAWAQFLGGSIPALFQATQVPDARDEDNVYATENACAAIAKILHFNSSAVSNADEIIVQWVNTLPVTNDEEAAPYAYAYLAELITKQHPAVGQRPDQIFVHIAKALEAQTLTSQTAQRVCAAAKMLLQATSTDPTPLLQQFPADAQQVIMSYFN